jgi:hypothetical protein
MSAMDLSGSLYYKKYKNKSFYFLLNIKDP